MHAEAAAINDAGAEAFGADIYTTLEPCVKRFPHARLKQFDPCYELIAQAGISRVVVGLVDANKNHRGKGIQNLVNSGIKVETPFFVQHSGSPLLHNVPFLEYDLISLRMKDNPYER